VRGALTTEGLDGSSDPAQEVSNRVCAALRRWVFNLLKASQLD
jgi:hypothetical protein